jgi:bifunctional non-homologous end joining protein LigD
MPLEEYARKRKFSATPEPGPSAERHQRAHTAPLFCVQRHDASRLHYDFRLEVDGVLASWAVPKGPSMDPARKALAVHVEDHPLDYATFEGNIPEGNYGAGSVMLWDIGTYDVLDNVSASEQIDRGDFKFALHGHKLNGSFALVRMKPRPGSRSKQEEWLLIKKPDEFAVAGWDVEQFAASVATQRSQEKIASGETPVPLEELEGAKKGRLPEHISPMLASLGDKPPAGPQWMYEVKWDGVRALCTVDNGKLRIESRTGHRCEHQYPELADLPSMIRAKQAVLDGEIAVLDEKGVSKFELIQPRISTKGSAIGALMKSHPARLFLFDLLYIDGYDLRDVALSYRKEQLTRVVKETETIRVSGLFDVPGSQMMEAARRLGLEGVMAKDRNSAYESGRSRAWWKLKIVQEQEFVIGGYTKGEREYFGALVLGVWDEGRLRHVGQVGTGFDVKMMMSISKQMTPLVIEKSPFAGKINMTAALLKGVTWVKPELVAEVKFHEWTNDGNLRAPVFLGLRADKPSKEVTRERPEEVPSEEAVETKADSQRMAKAASKARSTSRARPHPDPSKIAGKRLDLVRAVLTPEQLAGNEAAVEVDSHILKLTNLNKIYWPKQKYTKRDLIEFYDRVSAWLLPHLLGRPLSLKRYPNGIDEPHFFQKDTPDYYPRWIPREAIVEHAREDRSKEKTNHYVVANDRATLLYLANLGCIDHNPWMSRVGSLEHPDWILIDLDPVECPYDQIVEAAQLVHRLLERFHLRGYPKTTGGDGMHIYIPLEPVYTFEQARTFAEVLATLAVEEAKDLFTTPRSLKKRTKGRVYFDWMQIASGKTVSAPYVPRAYDGAPVATPLEWKEVANGLNPKEFTIHTVVDRFERVGDLFAPVLTGGQRLEDALKALG